MAAAALAPAGREYHFEDSHFTFNITATGITNTDAGRAAAVGYALSIDTSVTPVYGAAPTLKLAADGDEIFGRLETLEDRSQDGGALVGDVSLRFIGALPMKSGETPAVGASIVGAGSGEVKTRPAYAVDQTPTADFTIAGIGTAKTSIVYGYSSTFVNVAFGV